MVTRSPDQQRQAAQLAQMVEMATLVKAVALARIADREHYLDLGHPSFKAFAESDLPFGYRNAKRYLKVGRKFAPMLPGFDPAGSTEGNPVSLLPAENPDTGDTEGDQEKALQFSQLGLRKLTKLTSLDDAAFEDVAREGKLVMPDGETEYTLDELMDMKTAEASKAIEEAKMDKEAYRAKAQQEEEKRKRLEKEREAEAEKIQEAEERLEKARKLEALYGPEKRTYEARERAMGEAASHLREVRRLVVPLQMEESAPQGLCNQLLELVREANATTEAMKQGNAGAFHAAEDTIERDLSHADDVIDDFFAEEDLGPVDPAVEAEGGERLAALREDGWHVQQDASGGPELICEDAGYTTRPCPSLEEAISTAEHIQTQRAEGSVPPIYHLGK
jgi:chemotaxis protein histidine kinase CheA